MSFRITLLVFLLFAQKAVTGKCLSNEEIVTNYFRHRNIQDVTIFDCCNSFEKINLAKGVMTQLQTVSIFSVNEKNIQKKLSTKYYHVGVILNLDCSRSTELLIESGDLNFFDEKHHWLLITFSKIEDIIDRFQNVTLNINVDIQVAIFDNDLKIWSMYDIYNPASKKGGTLHVTKIGFYNENLGYKYYKSTPKYWSRKNVTGVHFSSLIVLPAGFEGTLENYLKNDDGRTSNTFNRFHERVNSFCRDYYNYSVKITVTDSWGYTNPDGTFDGMVGALARKEIDFGSSPLFFRDDRNQVIDYGRNTWNLRTAFIFRSPKAHTSIKVFLQPLPSSVWIITILLGIISIIILKIVTTFEKLKYHFRDETSWSVSVLVTVAAFCQQGFPSTPKMTCGRITTISIFVLSILIYQFYSASLVSHLLMKPATNMRTLKDLLHSSLKAGCEDILYDKDYFKHTTDEIAIELYHTKILGKNNFSNFLSPEDGLKRVQAGGFAFHVDTATGYPIIENTFPEKVICELREIELFKTKPMFATFQKHSPFKEMFDHCYQKLAEYGLLYREKTHWHPRKPECIMSSRTINFHVGLDEFYPALIIILFGILISLVILFFEYEIKAMRKKDKKKLVVEPIFPYVN